MKKLVGSIALLNLLDAVLTAYGLHHAIIEEENPLMLYLWEVHPFLFFAVKMSLSLLLLWLFFHPKAKQRFQQKNLRFFRYTLLFLLILYSCIFVLHSVWIALYFM